MSKLYRLYADPLQKRDGQFVQDSSTYSPQRADLRLLAIPTSYFQVSENNSITKIFKGLLQLTLSFLTVIFNVAHM